MQWLKAGVWDLRDSPLPSPPPTSRWGGWADRVKVPVRGCRSALGARLPACRGKEGTPGRLAAALLNTALEPAEAAALFARKTAAVAEDAKPGGERGRGCGHCACALHCPPPYPTRRVGVEDRGGRPGFVPGLRDFPYPRGGRVQRRWETACWGRLGLCPWRE